MLRLSSCRGSSAPPRHRDGQQEASAPDARARSSAQSAVALRRDHRQQPRRADLPLSGPPLGKYVVPERPNQLWVEDPTYVGIPGGYLAAILDTCSRRVVGYAISRSVDGRCSLRAFPGNMQDAWRLNQMVRRALGAGLHQRLRPMALPARPAHPARQSFHARTPVRHADPARPDRGGVAGGALERRPLLATVAAA